MITVCLYGGLREYGRRFSLHAETPAEALHALFTQVRGLKQRIRDGIYQVRFSGEDQSEETIADVFRRPAAGVLHIVPRVSGAGKNGGIIQTVLGIVLIVVGAYTSWAGGGSLVAAGIGMVAGGVAQMLTKQPKLQTSKGIEDSKNTAFSNLANTSAQGRPVPLAYGLCYCGSRVVSQGVQSRRIDPAETAASSGAVAEIGLSKTFTAGVAAEAPNGQKYNTDFSDDSVRARNYTASFSKV